MIRCTAHLDPEDFTTIKANAKASRRSLAAELGFIINQALKAQMINKVYLNAEIIEQPWTPTKSNIK